MRKQSEKRREIKTTVLVTMALCLLCAHRTIEIFSSFDGSEASKHLCEIIASSWKRQKHLLLLESQITVIQNNCSTQCDLTELRVRKSINLFMFIQHSFKQTKNIFTQTFPFSCLRYQFLDEEVVTVFLPFSLVPGKSKFFCFI